MLAPILKPLKLDKIPPYLLLSLAIWICLSSMSGNTLIWAASKTIPVSRQLLSESLVRRRCLEPCSSKDCDQVLLCDGLSSLTSDSRGHLWYVSQELGVVEFDGSKRWVYTLAGDTFERSHTQHAPRYMGLAIDRHETPWVWIDTFIPGENLRHVAREQVVMLRNGMTTILDRAETYQLLNLVPPPYSHPGLRESLEAQQEIQERPTIYALVEDQRQSYPFERLGGLLFDRQNRLHLFPHQSLEMLIDQQGREWRSEKAITSPPLNDVPLHVVKNGAIVKLFSQLGSVELLHVDSRGHIWFANASKGCQIGHISPWYTVFCKDKDYPFSQPGLSRINLAEGLKDIFWAGSDSGLARFNGQSWQQIPLKAGAINLVNIDRRGRIVALHEHKGKQSLVLIQPQFPFTAVYYPAFTRYDGLDQLHIDKLNRIWLANGHGEILRYEDGKGLKRAFNF